LSVNGRVEFARTRYYAAGQGSDSPMDRLVDAMESSVSVGMRELCCRLGIAGRSFARSAENLKEAARVHRRAAAERLGLVDGAVCLRNHLEVLPLEVVLLDFYHLSDHVNDASRKTLGEKTQAGEKWVGQVLHRLKHEGYEPFFQELVDWRSGLRGGKRKAADRLLKYVAQREAMMGYAQCQARGWDMGTGPMESMCGVTTDRLKGRGRRWDLDNAESLMALEAMYQSHLWEQYWAKALRHQN
jgi:hypothetical protein